MLTGRPLFLRSNEAATLYAIMNAPIPPPSRMRADVPRQLDEIVHRAVARAPEDRYATAEQMASAIDDFMVHMPRYDARVLASKVEELFGSTRAEAKRSIAQTRSLPRNISMVMKLRSEVRADLAERLDAAVAATAHGDYARARTGSEGPASIARPVSQTRPPSQARPVSQAQPVPVQVVPVVASSRSQGGLLIALAVVMVTGIGAGIGYIVSRPDQQQVARLAQAAIEITTTPPGAAVFVGGEPTGLKTPTTLTGITKPQLLIRLELAGHAPVSKSVAVPAGATTSTQVTLTRLEGRIVISDLPGSAAVFVDTEEYAAGEVMPVTAGRHTIRIVIDGRTVAEQSTDTTTGDQYWKFARGKLVRN